MTKTIHGAPKFLQLWWALELWHPGFFTNHLISVNLIPVMIVDIRFIFTNIKPHILRIPKNQSIQNTPSWCSNFNFSLESVSNLNCFQGRVGKSR